jgi:P27 family predicted phage terminase small subunit
MKISDFLSPADVTVDIDASNKSRLLQDLAAKAAGTLNLSAGARTVWERIAPLLVADGRLTELDRVAFAIFCSAVADWFAANQALQTYGAVIKSPSGYPVQSPYVSIASKHLDTIIRLAVEFGLTPASRSRVGRRPDASPWLNDLLPMDTSELSALAADPSAEM